MNDSNPIQIKIVTLNVRGLNKSIKRRSDGYINKTHISIFYKKLTAMKN